MNIGIVIPRIEQGIFGEEVIAAGLKEGLQSHGAHQVALFDERNLVLAYQHPADLWLSLSYRFNPALTAGHPVCFHWNLHSPHSIEELGKLRYDAYFLNSTRLPGEAACGPIHLLEPGAWIAPPVQKDPRYRCRAVYVGNYSNRSHKEIAPVLDALGQEDVAIWGLGAWKESPWSVWYRGELPAEDLLTCYASADFIINITAEVRREHDMMPQRVVQAFACGKPVVTDFLPALQDRYGDVSHFYGIDPAKQETVEPERMRDHGWGQVAQRILTLCEDFRRPPIRPRASSPAWVWDTRFGTASSLDIFSQHSVATLEAQGVDIHVNGSFYPATPTVIKRLARKRVPATAEIYINVLGGLPEFEKLRRFACPLIYVFWAETTTILAKDVEYINKFSGALVQSRFSQSALQNSGVTAPVKIFPHGYDPAVFPWMERSKARPFTFLQVGIIQKRKGTDLLLRAFTELFGRSEDVRLVLKSRATDLNPHMQEMRAFIYREYGDYHNVHLIEDDIDERAVAELYAVSDVHVYPSRGEGFAMPLLEGAATGLPVIATAHGGYLDFLDEENAWLVPVAEYTRRDDLGWTHDCLWAEPDFEALKRWMWTAYEQRASLPEQGRRLYESVCEQWTWDKVIERCIPEIEALARDAPTRRSPRRDRYGFADPTSKPAGVGR